MKFVYVAIAAILSLMLGCTPAHAAWTIDGKKTETVVITEATCGYYSGGIAALAERVTDYGETAEDMRTAALRGASNSLGNTNMYVAWVMIIPDAKGIAAAVKDKKLIDYAKQRNLSISDTLQFFTQQDCLKTMVGETQQVPLRVYTKDGIKM